MGLTGLERAADLHDEDRAVFFGGRVLPLLGGEGGVFVLELLARNEGDLFRQVAFEAGELVGKGLLRLAERLHDLAHGILQRFGAPLFAGDDLLPVPLVDVDRVEIVEHLVTADGVHIGVKPGAGREAVARERETLPFRQRVDDLHVGAEVEDIELHRPFDAVEVVVEAGLGLYEEGRGHTRQFEAARELPLKGVLRQLDGDLSLHNVQLGKIVLRQGEVSHRHGG